MPRSDSQRARAAVWTCFPPTKFEALARGCHATGPPKGWAVEEDRSQGVRNRFLTGEGHLIAFAPWDDRNERMTAA